MGVLPYATNPEPATASQAEPAGSDPRQQVLGLKQKLEEALSDVVRLQGGLTSHENLQHLLTQGRALLQELRTRLEQVSGERDKLKVELGQTRAQLQQTLSERDQLDAERYTLQRALEEATAKQRELIEDLEEQRQQIDSLRDAAIRAQSLAREIMQAHEIARPQQR